MNKKKPSGDKPVDCSIDCHSGVCVAQNGKATCICYQGYSGEFCEEKMNPCYQAANPCKNGGTCQPEGPEFEI